jgi:hypothetical protein
MRVKGAWTRLALLMMKAIQNKTLCGLTKFLNVPRRGWACTSGTPALSICGKNDTWAGVACQTGIVTNMYDLLNDRNLFQKSEKQQFARGCT